jgi:hypothetical protein
VTGLPFGARLDPLDEARGSSASHVVGGAKAVAGATKREQGNQIFIESSFLSRS